jgi:hypothetical protein
MVLEPKKFSLSHQGGKEWNVSISEQQRTGRRLFTIWATFKVAGMMLWLWFLASKILSVER